MKKFISVVGAVAIFIYPVAVYFGIKHFEPRLLAVIFGLLLLIKLAVGGRLSFAAAATDAAPSGTTGTVPPRLRLKGQSILAGIFIAGIILYTVGSNEVGGLKLYPVIVNLFLLASFGYSLLHPPTVIERIARITNPELTPAGVRYTRKVTMLWCGFFLLNAAVALYTIFFAPMEIWAVYNGLISYLLIGSLLAGEYLYRTFLLKKD